MKLTLCYAPQTCATVPFITLTEAGADFEVHNLNSRSGQLKSAGFLALNPKHKVPVLIIDGDPLTENLAIQVWIARNFPAAKLLPADPMAEVKAVSFMSFCGSGIHPHLTPNARPENYCDLPGSAENVKKVGNKLLFEDFTIVENLLAGREWFFDHFTASDAYFFWCFRRAISFGLDLSQFKNCMAHRERMQQRTSVQMLVAHEKRVMEEFSKAA
jgi:glutathione S-transferase